MKKMGVFHVTFPIYTLLADGPRCVLLGDPETGVALVAVWRNLDACKAAREGIGSPEAMIMQIENRQEFINFLQQLVHRNLVVDPILNEPEKAKAWSIVELLASMNSDPESN